MQRESRPGNTITGAAINQKPESRATFNSTPIGYLAVAHE